MFSEFRLIFEACLPPPDSVRHRATAVLASETTHVAESGAASEAASQAASNASPMQRAGSAAWFNVLLERLWQHGCFYSFNAVRSAQWEEELHTSLCSFGLEDDEPEAGSLATYISRAAQVPYSFLDVSNGVSLLRMGFDFSPAKPESERLSTVSIEASDHDTTPPGKDGRPYLYVVQAFLHTCAVLCEALDPLYGLGYDLSHISSQEGMDALAFLGDVTAPALLRGHLPARDRWFNTTPIEYLAPAYLTPERTSTRLASTGCTMQRLSTGGLLIIPTIAPYTYEASSGYQLRMEGREAWQTVNQLRQVGAQTDVTEQVTEQIAQVRQNGIRALERAAGLFAVAQATNEEREARRLLTYFEERKEPM